MKTDSFNLHETLNIIQQAMQAVVCHMLFDFALHGIIFSAFLSLIGFYLTNRKYPHALSIQKVAKRIVIFCLLLTIPGALSLLIDHRLPDAGVFSFNSIGLLCFWSLISVHLVFEEINNSMVKNKQIETSTSGT